MENVPPPPACWRFGVFEVDPESGELRKQGRRVRLSDQSFQVLLALLERPGEVVSRQQLQERLWPDDTFVDFDANLNTAISLLRDALGDSAKNPRFIETLPRRGYRFLADVRREEPHAVASAADPPVSALPAPASANRGFAIALLTLIAVTFGGLSYFYTRASPEPVESIAVLPLVYAGPQTDGDQEYLADGLTSALITELARLGVPSVISETSILQYKGVRKPLPEIARELGADILVEGSVQREGNTVRVNAQLIDAGSDRHLWAQSYQQEMTSILQLQSEIAGAIVREIRTRLTLAGPVENAPRKAVNAAAHEAYLRGRHALRTEIEERRSKSVAFFNEAIRLDPTFAPAYQGLADYYGLTDALPPDEASANARRYARQALDLDGTLAAAHTSLALASWWGDWDWAGTEREFQQALDLDPNDVAARRWYGLFLDLTARPQAAFVQLHRVKELDPVSPFTYHALSYHFFVARRFQDALKQAQIVQDLSPHDPKVFESLGALYIFTGAYSKATSLAEQGIALWGRDASFIVSLALSAGRAGERERAKGLLTELQALAKRRYVPPCWFSMIHMELGELDRAFEWLEKAYAVRDGYLVHMKVSPQFDAVRGDPRFQDLLGRMNFPASESEHGTR
jgi:TolB-like protein/DNA-binding winged helix-turn-helix (wHTH) protein/tetratricopeptide (TPR) repeat protein